MAITTETNQENIKLEKPWCGVQLHYCNIRMCQGCRSSLRLTDGSILAPPFDLVMARAQRRTFRDKSSILVTPLQQQSSRYHLHWIVHEQFSQILFH